MASRRQKSHVWYQRHIRDPFVQAAQKEGYRSRASYKLKDILKRYRCIQPGMQVIELGAAPGGWTQLLKEILGTKGRLLAVDRLPFEAIEGVVQIQGDFMEDAVQAAIDAYWEGNRVDAIVSDMAPDLKGIPVADQAAMIALAESVLAWSIGRLKPEGVLLMKIFQGSDLEAFVKRLKEAFQQVIFCKPEASRRDSREIYLLAKKPKLV